MATVHISFRQNGPKQQKKQQLLHLLYCRIPCGFFWTTQF